MNGDVMALIGFKARFAGPVSRGEKRQTVRLWRKHPIHSGEMLHLYTGLRTPRAKLLMRARCCYAASVYLDVHLGAVDGIKMTHEEREDFARRDGFKGWPEFVACLGDMHELPFEGQVIRW